MAQVTGTKAPKRFGWRTALGAGILSLALLAGGAGVASASTVPSHRSAAQEERTKRDARDHSAERTSKDKATDTKDGSSDGNSGGSSDGSGDPQSPDPVQPTDG